MVNVAAGVPESQGNLVRSGAGIDEHVDDRGIDGIEGKADGIAAATAVNGDADVAATPDQRSVASELECILSGAQIHQQVTRVAAVGAGRSVIDLVITPPQIKVQGVNGGKVFVDFSQRRVAEIAIVVGVDSDVHLTGRGIVGDGDHVGRGVADDSDVVRVAIVVQIELGQMDRRE